MASARDLAFILHTLMIERRMSGCSVHAGVWAASDRKVNPPLPLYFDSTLADECNVDTVLVIERVMTEGTACSVLPCFRDQGPGSHACVDAYFCLFLLVQADRQYLLFSDIPNNRIWKWEVSRPHRVQNHTQVDISRQYVLIVYFTPRLE